MSCFVQYIGHSPELKAAAPSNMPKNDVTWEVFQRERSVGEQRVVWCTCNVVSTEGGSMDEWDRGNTGKRGTNRVQVASVSLSLCFSVALSLCLSVSLSLCLSVSLSLALSPHLR